MDDQTHRKAPVILDPEFFAALADIINHSSSPAIWPTEEQGRTWGRLYQAMTEKRRPK